MRVLWFCNTPAASDEAVGSNGTGSWLKSLDKELQKSVDLNIAFYSKTKSEPFRYGMTTYYPIKDRRTNFKKYINQFFPHIIDKEDLPIYLGIIKEVSPDIIDIHGTENPFTCILKNTTVPVVVTIQGCLNVIFPKFLAGIQTKYLRTKQYTSFKQSLLRGYIKDYRKMHLEAKRERSNMINANYIIGRTDWDRRVSSILSPNAAYFVSERILREPFYHAIWEDSYHIESTLIVHSTISCASYKGFETICSALNLLNLIGLDVEWRVAGISKDDLINKIVKRQLSHNYPSKGLKLLGKIEEGMLCKLLLQAHVYVLPSHIENESLGLSEAMMLGLPCISTFVGGTATTLKDGLEGIQIQDGDPWAMAGAILELVRDRSVAIEYGKNARCKALIRNDKGNVVKTLINTYSSIISH